jgi:hypothetical protein
MTDNQLPEPPGALEERVVGTLRARGLLRAGPGAGSVPRGAMSPRGVWAVAIAAGLLLFVGGFALGRAPRGSPVADLRQYTLLLYEGPEFNEAGAAEPDLVREYSAWAGELARRGRLVSGEKLGNQAWTIGTEPAAGPSPTGFFIVAAGDESEALAIARTCPHLRYGGSISVRPIEPT